MLDTPNAAALIGICSPVISSAADGEMQRVDCGGAERKRIAEDERLRTLVIAGGRRHENIVRIEESGQFIGIEGIASVEGGVGG